MAESISLEETNAIRAKLGLPTLGGGGSGDESEEQVIDRDQEAFENYQKQKEQEKKTKESEEIKARIEKSKNRKKDRAKLQGKGLGEADNNNDDSALDWIRKSRKRQKELAKKREREQAEMDQSFVSQAAEYNASDLSGLKVGHDISEFAEGGETILTLKDRGILEEQEGDDHDAQEELTNVNLEDKERLQKNLENKKKKPGYNPYDDEEFILGGKKKSLLPQYDEDTGPQGFQIGQKGRIEQEENKKNERESLSVSEKLKAQTLSYQKMQDIKDYYTQDEVNLGFKKPKKKKKKDKLRKRVKEQEDDQDNNNDDSTQSKTTTTTTTTNGNDNKQQPKEQQLPKSRIIDTDTSFVDDDDLQMALARTRRAANRQREKKTKKLTPEEIARSIAAERSQENTQEESTQEDSEKEGGLVLSEMSEFVNSIGTEAVFTPREPARSVREAQAQAAEAEAQAEAAAAAVAAQATEQSIQEISTATTIQDVPEEGEEQDTHMEQPTESALSSTTPAPTTEEEKTAIMEEPLVSGGMAATLSLLNQKGFISTPTKEQVERDRILSKRMRWIAEQKKLEAQREREREQEKLRQRERDHNSMRNSSRMDRDRAREREREREREKEIEEREDMREYMKRMEEYKPDVKLEYFDEHGHQMNTKEAFRFMSHKFHGKTSGKTKTEKRMAKLEEELKLNMMSNNDTPLNLATKLLERQQRTGNAHVVLSVGNRGVAAPSTSEMVASELAEPSSSPSSSTTKKSIKRGRVDDDHNDEPSDKKRK